MGRFDLPVAVIGAGPFGVSTAAVRDWWRSFKGPKEFAGLRWNDPVPFMMIWIRLAMASEVRAGVLRIFLLWRSQLERS